MAPQKSAVRSSSKVTPAYKLFENDDIDSGQESVEIDSLPAADLTTASEFETGCDDGDDSDGPGAGSDSNGSFDDEVELITYRKVSERPYFLMFPSI